MKRLLVVTPMMPPQAGGPGTYAAILARELPKLGVEVSIANYGEALAASRRGPKWALFSEASRLATEADAVLALDPASVGPVAYLVAKMARKPFYLRVPGDYAWEQATLKHGETRPLDEFVAGRPRGLSVQVLWCIERFIARRATKVIVPSEYLRKIVRAWGVPDANIVTVGNAYDGATAAPVPRAEVRTALGVALAAPLVVTAGRLVPWKGIAELVSVFTGIRDRYPSAVLAIAGDGPERARIEHAVSAAGLADSAKLLGSLPKERLHALLAAADVFALNSRYEGLSHQILEAMALGVPVVATDVGGNPEVVRDGETGWLVPQGDDAALGRAILEVLTDTGEAARRATRARALVAAMTPEKVAVETVAALGF